eukprot:scaffold40574_cov27-Tisochrysis_lutea.AAC.14
MERDALGSLDGLIGLFVAIGIMLNKQGPCCFTRCDQEELAECRGEFTARERLGSVAVKVCKDIRDLSVGEVYGQEGRSRAEFVEDAVHGRLRWWWWGSYSLSVEFDKVAHQLTKLVILEEATLVGVVSFYHGVCLFYAGLDPQTLQCWPQLRCTEKSRVSALGLVGA